MVSHLSDTGCNFHVKKSSEWQSQQEALIAHFNQLSRWRGLFRLDHYKFLFCLSTPLDKFCGERWASHLFCTSDGSRIVICCCGSTTWEKDELSCSPQTTDSLIKPAGRAAVMKEIMVGDGFCQWGPVLSEQSIHSLHIKGDKVQLFVTLRGKCLWSRLRSQASIHELFSNSSMAADVPGRGRVTPRGICVYRGWCFFFWKSIQLPKGHTGTLVQPLPVKARCLRRCRAVVLFMQLVKHCTVVSPSTSASPPSLHTF